MTGRSVAVGLLALVIAACTSVRSPTPGQPHLGLSNATTMRVSLVVNGVGAGAYPPGASVGLKPAELPPLPWHVEVRTGEGRVLASIDVPADDPYMTAQPAGETTAGAIVAWADLSCGSLVVWAGSAAPRRGPGPPAMGVPGDCDP